MTDSGEGSVPEGPPLRLPGPPSPYGAFEIVNTLGGVAAPLLAGFAITMIALIIQIADALSWPDVALVLFGLAATLFLSVVQVNARARGYAVTPSQVREWYDDYDSPERRRRLAWELHHHREIWGVLVRRARISYNCAIVALLGGIAVLLVPHEAARLTVLRWTAIAVILVALLLELVELADEWLGRRSRGGPVGRSVRWIRRVTRVLAPSDPPVDPPPYRR